MHLCKLSLYKKILKPLCYSLIILKFMIFESVYISLAKEGTIARFSDLHGEVLVRPDEIEEAWEQAEIDTNLKINDHVKTGNNSSAIIGFLDLSTLVLKSKTEIILTSPSANTNSIKVIFGNIWVNVKKVLTDQNLEIEMSQAVAGIKGTNITCKTNRNEDLVQVLRGEAEVLIKLTKEIITLKEGEELLIKKGGETSKRSIDVEKIQKEWIDELQNLGSNINLDETESQIKKMLEEDEQLLQKIKSTYDEINNSLKIESDQNIKQKILDFSKLCERSLGIIFEHTLIANNLNQRLNNEIKNAPDKKIQQVLLSKLKIVNNALSKINSYKAEINKMIQTISKVLSEPSRYDLSELNTIIQELYSINEEYKIIERELSLKPHGLSQDWFRLALEQCQSILNRLNTLSDSVEKYLNKNPTDKNALQLQRNLSSQISRITNFIRDLKVIPISKEVLIEMQQTDDIISNLIVALNKEIDIYNQLSKESAQNRLKNTLSILRNFSKARRLFNNAQRLYDSIMRDVSRQKYLTAEQLELKNIYQRIQDNYQRLAINANILESKLNELESQLRDVIKDE